MATPRVNNTEAYVGLIKQANSHFFCLPVSTASPTSNNLNFNYDKNGVDWEIDSEGHEQSPIDIIDETVESSVTQYLKIWWNHLPLSAEVRDTGATLIVEAPISRITGTDTVDRINRLYEPMQFHFHSPSEHTINGKQYPLEMHIVHMVEYEYFEAELVENHPIKRYLGVIGILFEIDDTASPSAFIDSLQLDKVNMNEKVTLDLTEFMAFQRPEYYGYSGSLTSPPCSEIVNWFLLKHVFKMTSSQFAKFADRSIFQGNGNSRAVQPLNGRRICCGNCQTLTAAFSKGFGLSKQSTKSSLNHHGISSSTPQLPKIQTESITTINSSPIFTTPSTVQSSLTPSSNSSQTRLQTTSLKTSTYDIINPSRQPDEKLPVESTPLKTSSRYESQPKKSSVRNRVSSTNPLNSLFRLGACAILNNR